MFFNIILLKKFVNFTGKNLCVPSLGKLQALRTPTLLKRDSNTDFAPAKFAKFLRTPCFTNLQRLLLLV